MQISKISFFLFILSLPIFTSAQNTDYELWSGISAQIKAGKKNKFTVEQQFRFNDTLSSFKNTFTAVSWRLKLSKRFSFKTIYRLTIVPEKNNHGRISTDLTYRWSKKKFPLRIKNRLRYQRRSTFNSDKRASYIRNKLTFDYNASKLVDPYVAGEIFYRLDSKNEFRAWRVNSGLSWRLNKRLNLNTYYQFELEFNAQENNRSHLIGIDLIWKVN